MKRNTAWMLISRILRTSVAVVYFTLLARSLGASGYGAFMGVCALASILAPFASLGSGNLLIRDVTCDRAAFARRWGTCLVAIMLSGALLVIVALALARFVLPRTVPLLGVLWIAMAELLFARLLDVAGMAFQAVERLSITALFSFGLTACRCAAAAFLLCMSPHANADSWSWLYLLSTALPACIATLVVHRQLRTPSFQGFLRLTELRDGLFFSISLAAQTIYNDVDKTMLARLVSLASAGLYAAAYRIVDAAFSPVNALMCAAYSKFFQLGERGLREASRFGVRMFLGATAYSLVGGVALWMAAPWVRVLLGEQFGETAEALRLLSPLLVLRSAHVFAADTLTGAGYQGTRTFLQVSVAGVNVLLNLALLPRYSWRGACYTTLLCDGSLAVFLCIAIAVLQVRQSRQMTTGCAVAES